MSSSYYPSVALAPMRAKVSADFPGAINTDNLGAASAGVTYTGALRPFWLSNQGLLINVNVDESLFEDLILIVPTAGGYSWRPLRVRAAGTVGWVHAPIGWGMPGAGLLPGQWQISVKAKQAIASLIVTSQPFDY